MTIFILGIIELFIMSMLVLSVENTLEREPSAYPFFVSTMIKRNLPSNEVVYADKLHNLTAPFLSKEMSERIQPYLYISVCVLLLNLSVPSVPEVPYRYLCHSRAETPASYNRVISAVLI